jgi:hypothetical protein
MKTLLATILVSVLTVFSIAQTEDSNVQFGFGVNLSREVPTFTSTQEMDIFTLPIDLANFSFVIKGKNFRIEPSLGYFTGSTDNTSGQYSYESSISNFRIGTVIAYNNSSFESMNFYYGIDVGVILSSVSTSSNDPFGGNQSTDESKTDFFIGPAIGGEYMYNKYFSLGGEINLNYISVGNYGDGDSTTWLISTRGAVYVRWYVN